MILCAALGCERAHLITHAGETVDAQGTLKVERGFERRRGGQPVAYITGRREFYGRDFHVTSDVLIPRPETERLVDLALEYLPRDSPARVLELGTGCGAIAVTLARERVGVSVIATDVSEAALEVARGNARSHSTEVQFARGDWFAALPAGRFDVIVSNPPYVALADAHLEQGDLRFEPRLALVGGEDGLACIRAIATCARGWLAPGGRLLLEHGYDQGDRCSDLLRELGYADVEDFEDLAGVPRVCAGREPN